jgi:hypothetical protein
VTVGDLVAYLRLDDDQFRRGLSRAKAGLRTFGKGLGEDGGVAGGRVWPPRTGRSLGSRPAA